MPDWINYSNVISSLGFGLTVLTYFSVKTIRQSFVIRARLPQLNKDLSQAIPKLSTALQSWDARKSDALEVLSIIKAILENIESKVPSKEKRKVQDVLDKLNPTSWYIFSIKLSEVDENSLWEIYTDLNGVVSSLDQLIKDSRWD